MKCVYVGGFLYLSHWRSVQLAMIHRETIKTRRTVPGHIVINVLSTNRVLKLIRFRAPIDRDEASVNSLLCETRILIIVECCATVNSFRVTENISEVWTITRLKRSFFYSRMNIDYTIGPSYQGRIIDPFPSKLNVNKRSALLQPSRSNYMRE